MRPNDILNLTLEPGQPGQTLLLVPRLSHVKREVGEGIRLSLCELFGIESCAVFGINGEPSEQRDSDLASFQDGVNPTPVSPAAK